MRFAHTVVLTLIARVFATIGPFGVSIITARMLGPADRGLYFLALSIAQITAQVSNFGLHASNTYIAAQRPHLLSKLVVNSLYVATLVTPLMSLLVIPFFIYPNWSEARLEILCAILLAPTLVAFLFISNAAVGVGRVKLFNGLIIFSGASAVIAAGLVALIKGPTLDYLIAATAASLLSCVVGYALLLRRQPIHLNFDRTLFKEGIPLAFRAYVVTLLGFLMLRIGIIALQSRSSLHELGQFSIASQLFDGLMILPSTIGLLLFPKLVRAKGHDRWTMLWRTFWQLSALMLLLVGILGPLLPWIIPIVFGTSFTAAIPISISFLPAVIVFSCVTVISQYLSSEGYPWRQVVAWIVGLVSQAILSYMLAAPYGGLGISIALTISILLTFAILLREAFIVRARSATEQIRKTS